MVTAIVLIQAAAERIPEAAQEIADIDGVTEVYSCAGDVDLIALVKVSKHEDLAALVPGKISKVAGRAEHRHAHRVPQSTRSATTRRRSPSAWRRAGSRTAQRQESSGEPA